MARVQVWREWLRRCSRTLLLSLSGGRPFQLPDALHRRVELGFGLHARRPFLIGTVLLPNARLVFPVGAVLLVFKRCNVTARRRVMPAQLPVFPLKDV